MYIEQISQCFTTTRLLLSVNAEQVFYAGQATNSVKALKDECCGTNAATMSAKRDDVQQLVKHLQKSNTLWYITTAGAVCQCLKFCLDKYISHSVLWSVTDSVSVVKFLQCFSMKFCESVLWVNNQLYSCVNVSVSV